MKFDSTLTVLLKVKTNRKAWAKDEVIVDILLPDYILEASLNSF